MKCLESTLGFLRKNYPGWQDDLVMSDSSECLCYADGSISALEVMGSEWMSISPGLSGVALLEWQRWFDSVKEEEKP